MNKFNLAERTRKKSSETRKFLEDISPYNGRFLSQKFVEKQMRIIGTVDDLVSRNRRLMFAYFKISRVDADVCLATLRAMKKMRSQKTAEHNSVSEEEF